MKPKDFLSYLIVLPFLPLAILTMGSFAAGVMFQDFFYKLLKRLGLKRLAERMGDGDFINWDR